jgi:hypothetical protein
MFYNRVSNAFAQRGSKTVFKCLIDGCSKILTRSDHIRTYLKRRLCTCPFQERDAFFTRRDPCFLHQRTRHHISWPESDPKEGEYILLNASKWQVKHINT